MDIDKMTLEQLEAAKAKIERRIAELKQRDGIPSNRPDVQGLIEAAKRKVLQERAEKGRRDPSVEASARQRRALVRASNLARIKAGYATLDAYGQPYIQLPLDRDVIDHADPYDDRLPVNFDTRSPDWKEFVASGRYDEFCDEYGLRHTRTTEKPPAYSKIDENGNEVFYDEDGKVMEAPESGW